ncbi:MAG: DUF6029 family protein [Bacteroidales bacterium]|nr:DUF6029 family protein [Bacteroidales bacterium]MDD4604276.1 DUF6029 family protein [Bacteroidales bacterium]
MTLKKGTLLVVGFLWSLCIIPGAIHAQDILKGSEVHGSTQLDAVYYLQDNKMGITDSTLDGKLMRMNGFTEVNYSLGNFTAGLRFEAYLPALTGYDVQNNGVGVPYFYANYKNDFIDITAGNFYEQFGNGMMLRTYQEWTLGYDNSIRGLRVKVMPYKGITLKGVYGVQRYYWEPYKDYNRGIVKGFDADFYLNDMFTSLSDAKVKLTLGGSFVSDYQQGKTKEIADNGKIYLLKMPENVSNYGGRFNLNIGGFNWFTEYAHKINDPNALNNYIYKDGNGLFTNFSYSKKGLGISLMSKWIDNMSYKSDRTIANNMVNINYLPSITKEHTYALASMYPYATQPDGEVGISGTVTIHFPKNSTLGGKTGLSIAANFSQVNGINKTALNDTTMVNQLGTLGYNTSFYSVGSEVYYQDANIEVTKKFGKNWKGIFTYLYQTYNKDIIEGHANDYGTIYSQIGIADISWNITKKNNLRFEFQGLWTKQDKGNWAAALVEYTVAPAWFLSVQDQWNYGNSDSGQQLHYYLLSAGYTNHTTRVALSWGRQREGIICVGGVCRYVPAANGVTLTVTSSF